MVHQIQKTISNVKEIKNDSENRNFAGNEGKRRKLG